MDTWKTPAPKFPPSPLTYADSFDTWKLRYYFPAKFWLTHSASRQISHLIVTIIFIARPCVGAYRGIQ